MDGAKPPSHTPPLSPHVQIWRWHVTMAASILNRAAGIALTAGLAGLVLWLCAAASGPYVYEQAEALLLSLPGQLVLYMLCVAAAYHIAAGLRHFAWDVGIGYRPATANATAWASILFALAAPVIVWTLAGI